MAIPQYLKAFDRKFNQTAFKQAAKLTITQFLNKTSIHGARHILDPRGNVFTKIAWIFILLICFVSAAALMVTFLIRYKSNPTRINVETNFGAINDIEFPAITFCNPSIIVNLRMEKLINSLETFDDGSYNNLTKSELKYRIKLLAGFTNSIESFNPNILKDLSDILNDNRFNMKLLMKKLMFPCTELLARCRWEMKIVSCNQLFRVSKTYQGYCCSFNIENPSSKKSVWKPLLFGPERGLSVVLKPQMERGDVTTSNSEGVKILINEFDLFPSEKTIERMLPLTQETFVEIRPEVTVSSKAIKALAIGDRGCVFGDEFQLSNFGSYKEQNCRVECTMRKTVEICQCLPYFYYNTQNIETCEVEKLDCIARNREVFKNIKAPLNETKRDCECPAQCDSIIYQIRMSSTRIEPKMEQFNIDPFHFNLTSNHMIVHIYFVSQFHRIFIRSLLTNFITLISDLGGVYALLIGMSLISTIEIFYFATVRLYFNYKSCAKNEKQIKAKKINLGTSMRRIPRLDTANHL